MTAVSMLSFCLHDELSTSDECLCSLGDANRRPTQPASVMAGTRVSTFTLMTSSVSHSGEL